MVGLEHLQELLHRWLVVLVSSAPMTALARSFCGRSNHQQSGYGFGGEGGLGGTITKVKSCALKSNTHGLESLEGRRINNRT